MKKKFCILMGSMKPSGNTAELVKPFTAELQEKGCDVEYITLVDKDIHACTGCYTCQRISDVYGCKHEDDALQIIATMLESDYIILATPIYSWYCTPPMKAMLDRHYGLNKYYGKGEKRSLWEGKNVAIIATHGFDAALAAEPFEMGIQRLCEYSKLNYLGMYSVRHEGSIASFQTESAINGAKEFARALLEK